MLPSAWCGKQLVGLPMVPRSLMVDPISLFLRVLLSPSSTGEGSTPQGPWVASSSITGYVTPITSPFTGNKAKRNHNKQIPNCREKGLRGAGSAVQQLWSRDVEEKFISFFPSSPKKLSPGLLPLAHTKTNAAQTLLQGEGQGKCRNSADHRQESNIAIPSAPKQLLLQ